MDEHEPLSIRDVWHKGRHRYDDASDEVIEIRRTRHAFLSVVLVILILIVFANLL